jgi:excisionase family DNA binding protein
MRVPTPMSIGRGVSSRSPSQGGMTVSRLSTSVTKPKTCSIVSARRTAIVSRYVPSRWRPICTCVRDLVKGVPTFCARGARAPGSLPCARRMNNTTSDDAHQAAAQHAHRNEEHPQGLGNVTQDRSTRRGWLIWNTRLLTNSRPGFAGCWTPSKRLVPYDDGEILTLRVVAELFAVSPRTTQRWADAGRLPSFRTHGGQRRFRWDDNRR